MILCRSESDWNLISETQAPNRCRPNERCSRQRFLLHFGTLVDASPSAGGVACGELGAARSARIRFACCQALAAV